MWAGQTALGRSLEPLALLDEVDGGTLGAEQLADAVDGRVERVGHELVHSLRLMGFHKVRLVTKAGEKLSQVRITQTAKYGWIRDLVSVQMQNGKNGAVANGI